MAIDRDRMQRSIAACIENGRCLLEEAQWGIGRTSTRTALAMLAQEECAKAFVLALVRDSVLPWTDDVRRSLSVHECKHVVTMIMEWLLTVNERRFAEIGGAMDLDASTKALPPEVATAMNIYQHELIERIGGRHPERYSEWRGRARKLAEGQRDRRKQAALYVRIGEDGSLASVPSVPQEVLDEELVRTKALLEFAGDADRHCIFAFREYEMFSGIFQAMFRDHGPDAESLPEERMDSGIPGVELVQRTIFVADVVSVDGGDGDADA
jgi:AbiV family abortive infection protein